MFENIFFENNEQTIKIKTQKKLQSSSHKWVFGKTYEKVKKNVWEKFVRVLFMFLCWRAAPATKKGTVLHLPQKHPSTAPSST